MKCILGIKKDMTQIWDESGAVVPVTRIQAGPCTVVQVKTEERDGYRAIQVGFGKRRKISRALQGHLKGLDAFRYLHEFRVSEGEETERGKTFDVSVFEKGDKVDVRSHSKGRGFQGVVKRHGFHGSPASHGHKDQLRMPGSIGATEPARVFKGTRMAGRMGGEQVCVKNMEVIAVDPDKGILLVKGAVPGARGSLVIIQEAKNA